MIGLYVFLCDNAHISDKRLIDRRTSMPSLLTGEVARMISTITKAAMNTRSVGAYTALVFEHLLTKAGASSSRMWCTEHSLGSHVCGHTGAYMLGNHKLGKITGLIYFTQSLTPKYISSNISCISALPSLSSLGSSASGMLLISCTRYKRFGNCSFLFLAYSAWNSLRDNLHDN